MLERDLVGDVVGVTVFRLVEELVRLAVVVEVAVIDPEFDVVEVVLAVDVPVVECVPLPVPVDELL